MHRYYEAVETPLIPRWSLGWRWRWRSFSVGFSVLNAVTYAESLSEGQGFGGITIDLGPLGLALFAPDEVAPA